MTYSRSVQWQLVSWLRTTIASENCSTDFLLVTKNLAFGITASTTFEPPFLLAKRLSTLDHLTNGRIGWYVTLIPFSSASCFFVTILKNYQEYCDILEESGFQSHRNRFTNRARRAIPPSRRVSPSVVQALGRFLESRRSC